MHQVGDQPRLYYDTRSNNHKKTVSVNPLPYSKHVMFLQKYKKKQLILWTPYCDRWWVV